jgi:hypothetical protein
MEVKMNIHTKANCRYCGKEYAKPSMIRHLASCKGRQSTWINTNSNKTEGYFSISVEGLYNKAYWLCIEVSENAKLKDVDGFLRDIWLECCGHLSSFKIDNVLYDVNPDDEYDFEMSESMDIKLKNVLYSGLEFRYEYDFGSTTTLKLKVIGYRKGAKKQNKIELMARNKPIETICELCGKNLAQYICCECMWEETANLCQICASEHKCGEEMLLPIVNSPRCGVCGYVGSEKYGDD